jgi:hypothetical protein
MFGLLHIFWFPSLSGSLPGFQRVFPDITSSLPGHVRPSPAVQQLSPKTGLVRFPGRVPVRLVRHVRPLTRTCPSLWHPNGQIPLGGYKRPPHLFNPAGHSIQHANSLRHPFLSSKPLSLKLHSNLSFLWEIWVSLLSDPLVLHSKHFIDDLCVFVTLGDLSLRRTRLSESHQGCGWPQKICIALSFMGIC